jgi:hypothetical protein
MSIINLRFQVAGHPAAAWAASNPVLLDRELGAETDSLRQKLGDGVTPWNSLPYLPIGGGDGTGGGWDASYPEKAKSPVILPENTNFSIGEYLVFAGSFEPYNTPMVYGKDYDGTVTVDPYAFPRQTLFYSRWPTGRLPSKGGIWAYNHCVHGNYGGAVVKTPIPARRVRDLGRVKTEYDWSGEGGPAFNALAETFLNSAAPENPGVTHRVEIGAYLHGPEVTHQFHRKGKLIGFWTDPDGIEWEVRRTNKFITCMEPLTGADRRAGLFHYDALFLWLGARGHVDGDWIYTGQALGEEVAEELNETRPKHWTRFRINEFSVDYSGIETLPSSTVPIESIFPPVVSSRPGRVNTSAVRPIVGITEAVMLYINGGVFSVNGAEFTGVPTMVEPWDKVRLQCTSPATPGDQVVTIDTGGTPMTYSVTTGQPVSAPTGGIYSSAAITDGWAATGLTATPNSVFAPDETTTALTLAPTATYGGHVYSQVFYEPLPAGEHALTLYAKRVLGENFLNVELFRAYGTALAGFSFNIDTGEISYPYGYGDAFTGITATIDPVFEFYRLTINFTETEGSQDFTVNIKAVSLDYDDVYLGDPDDAIAVWGMKLT